MPAITTDKTRTIIDDFAAAIRSKKNVGPRPATDVIRFRNEKAMQFERPVYIVPIELLRYRRDNGRIASDVINYEREFGPLDEKDASAQKKLEEFLAAKDPEKTDELMLAIQHHGQDQPAIITCDGFLINGNRRKMVFERLRKEHPGKPQYASMKVVILPGKDDPGGPPTLKEIEQIENRYQLQSEGKSEYYGFDRALSIKRKIDLGFSLEEQLADDPKYANVDEKGMKSAVLKIQTEYLQPLECVERYLRLFERPEHYGMVSTGAGDKEGRWQAFIDYSGKYNRFLRNPSWCQENNVPEAQIGAIEDAAFKLIRLRDLKDIGKIHMVMRQLPKLVRLKDSRQELVRISTEVEPTLPKSERVDESGHNLSPEETDARWVQKNRQTLLHRLKKAWKVQEAAKETDTPIELLEAALAKLQHDLLDVPSIKVDDLDRARRLTLDIQRRANDLEREIFQFQKSRDDLGKKK